MKKIIPFKKDITFGTNIGEINSISLERYVENVIENNVKGHFVLSGDYKLIESSLTLDPFYEKIPFEISVDKKYNTDDITVEIENFYYEVINNKVLSINIELSIDNLTEIVLTEDVDEERCVEVEDTKIYKVYIVKENDTLEKIIKENNTSKEALSMYNDLENIKLGDKIIIPSE